MYSINYNAKKYQCRDRETVLAVFLRNGVTVPFSCKEGICQVCLMRSEDDSPSALSQKGLNSVLKEKNYFKICQCIPCGDMKISLPKPEDLTIQAIVVEKKKLSEGIYRVLLEPMLQLDYQAGQFINVHHHEVADAEPPLIRSYSLASSLQCDYYLELHIKQVANGVMSHWLTECVNVGEEITFHGAFGDCYYYDDNLQQPLLLLSTGTGLSPHIGMVREALAKGHQGDIYLFHGSDRPQGHYLTPTLQALAQQYNNFHYHCCTNLPASQQQISQQTAHSYGLVTEIAFAQHHQLDNYRVYLSGHPSMVKIAEEKAQKQQAKTAWIYSDPFETQTGVVATKSQPKKQQTLERDPPPPDPEMWTAMQEGELLRQILTTFYTWVFEDNILKPYFVGVTKQRLIEKVYSFQYQLFTGEKVFFGERPRNGHHWMVISEEIFAHREALMEKALIQHKLAPHLIQRWLDYEAWYKEDIVKQQPINKVLFGEEIPYEGFDSFVMDVATLCDSCGGEVNNGDTVRYHVRLGTVYCEKCTGLN
jgi:ferredoxin-NADP reductase